MVKMIGICCILVGTCSGIAAWYLGKKEKIHRIEAILEFLRRVTEAVEQQIPFLPFLQSYHCRDALLAQALEVTVRELAANTWESGEAAWETAITGRTACRNWDMSVEQWEAFRGIGQIFCAGSREAILDILARQKRQWESFLETERQQLAQQQRVVLPVGLLSGMMVVLLLV